MSAITFVAYGRSRGKEHAKSAQGYTRQARELEKAEPAAHQGAMPNPPYSPLAGQPSVENAATVSNHEEPETGPIVIPRASFEGQAPVQPPTDRPTQQW